MTTVASLQRRIEALEFQRGTSGAWPWFDLGQWRADIAAGVSLGEREARALAGWPEHSVDIRRWYSVWQKRVGLWELTT